MKKICVFNQKGGVGKTTTNINIATYLAFQGKKVLVIDIDPQGNATSGLGIDKERLENSIYDLLTSDITAEEVIIKSEIMDNLYIIPSRQELAGAEIELANISGREFILRDKLKEKAKEFDFVIIDCPPSLGTLTINALGLAESVIIPIQCEYYALEGVSQLMNTINRIKQGVNPDIQCEGIVLTMYDNRSNLCNEVAEEVNKHFKELVFKTVIPRNIKLAEAPSFGLPILLYENKCKGAIAYENLTNELLKRQGR